MRDFSRTDRVANQLQKEIAVVLQREFKDPRLSMTTVSDVDVSRDLGVAKVHVTFFETDDDKIKQNVRILNDGASFIRTLVAKRVRMRVMPELRFHYDSSLVEGMRISNLVDNVVKGDKQKASDAGRDWDQEEN